MRESQDSLTINYSLIAPRCYIRLKRVISSVSVCLCECVCKFPCLFVCVCVVLCFVCYVVSLCCLYYIVQSAARESPL